MSELQSPSKVVPMVITTGAFNVSNIVANAVNTLQLVTSVAISAFTGTAAQERSTVALKAFETIELLVAPTATTLRFDLYFEGALKSTVTGVSGVHTSLGQIEKNKSYVLSVSSTVLVAITTSVGNLTTREVPTIDYYVRDAEVSTGRPDINYALDVYNQPTFTFVNAPVVAGNDIDLMNLYGTKVNGSYFLTYTGDFVTYFGGSTSATYTFNSGLNLLISLFFPTTGTFNGTVKLNFTGIGVPTFLPALIAGYVGQDNENVIGQRMLRRQKSIHLVEVIGKNVKVEDSIKEEEEEVKDPAKELSYSDYILNAIKN